MNLLNKIGNAELEALKKYYQGNLKEAEDLLKQNYPIQYLIGFVEFYNCKIKVNENVLIPRYETEYLVEKTINLLKNKNMTKGIDLCTGSGAIAIALAKNLNINIDACDISKEALKVAKENALINQVNISFFEKDILKEKIDGKYDFIISNPPYIKEDEYTSAETKYEPSIALYAKDSGLEFYKKILSFSKEILNPNGVIIFEIGDTLNEEIKKIALSIYPKATITIEKDYNNYNRFMFITINE